MRLSEYIRELGPDKFAKLYGVSRRAAQSWLYLQRTPSLTQGKRIVDSSPVTWDGIAEDAEYRKTSRKGSESAGRAS